MHTTTPYQTLHRIGAADAEPFSLAEAKLYLRIDHTQDDILISQLICAVRLYAEDYLGQSLTQQQWQACYDTPRTKLHLPMAPVLSVDDVRYTDDLLNTNIIAATDYQLSQQRTLSIDVLITPCTTLEVTYTSTVSLHDSANMRQAMMTHMAACYDQRSGNVAIPAYSKAMYNTRKELRI